MYFNKAPLNKLRELLHMHSSISAKMVKKRKKWKFINHMSST